MALTRLCLGGAVRNVVLRQDCHAAMQLVEVQLVAMQLVEVQLVAIQHVAIQLVAMQQVVSRRTAS